MNANNLHWTESIIESVVVDGRSLAVLASNVFVLGEHGARRVKVTYTGVAKAISEATEYIGDPRSPRGFKHPTIRPLLEPVALQDTSTYGIEGVTLFEPVAWIDIEIQAQGAVIEEL